MDSTQNATRQVHASADHGVLHSEPQPTTTRQAIDHDAAVHSLVHTAAAPPANLIQAAPSATATLEFTPRVENSIPHISTGLKSSSNIRMNDINPPEIQRVVVEHIVRNADVSSPVHTSNRLRSAHTLTVKWILKLGERMSSSSLKTQPYLIYTEQERYLKVSYPQQLLPLLAAVGFCFWHRDDGEELFAKFMNTLQDEGEKPSHYLNRLQVKRGGVAATEQDEHLLRQFCRGCWDSTVLTGLQLEQRKHNPPSFPEFLLLLRTEEDRQAAKAARMKQHLGAPNQRAATHLQCACTYEEKSTTSQQNNPKVDILCDTQNLKIQVAGLQSQIAGLKTQNCQTTRSVPPSLIPLSRI